MFGKPGEKPALPCNCKRPFSTAISHCPVRVGRRSRRAVGRESGDRSRQAHSPLFLGRRRTRMFGFSPCRFRLVSIFWIVLATLMTVPAQAQSPLPLHGKIIDPLGNSVPGATIVLLQGDKEIV